MSLYFKLHKKPEVRRYSRHGRTKQSYKDSCDINQLLERGAREGGLSHLVKHGARYGDFAMIDWENMQHTLAEGQQIFNELPAELKREFNQDPAEFFGFVNDPANKDRLEELIPAIANRGNFFPQPNRVKTRAQETSETSEAPQAPLTNTSEAEPSPEGETSSEGT